MSVSDKVTDDSEGNVMDIALGSLRARKTPMLKVDGLSWILDNDLRPAVVVGYGTNDPEQMSSIHHIIKFHCRKVPVFNVVTPKEDYAVKHTRVAKINVLIFDHKIPASDMNTASRFLTQHYIGYVSDVVQAFRNRGYVVSYVEPFENVENGKKRKSKAKLAIKPRVEASEKSHKRTRFIEEDDEEGPVRRLTPIRKQPVEPAPESERADSLDPAMLQNLITTKDPAGFTIIHLNPDSPVESTEGADVGQEQECSSMDVCEKEVLSMAA